MSIPSEQTAVVAGTDSLIIKEVPVLLLNQIKNLLRSMLLQLTLQTGKISFTAYLDLVPLQVAI